MTRTNHSKMHVYDINFEVLKLPVQTLFHHRNETPQSDPRFKLRYCMCYMSFVIRLSIGDQRPVLGTSFW